MPPDETDILAQAIADTEKELFVGAFGKDEPVLDETGDRSPEEIVDDLDGDDDDAADAEKSAKAADGDEDGDQSDDAADDQGDKPGRDKETGKFVAKDKTEKSDTSDAKDDADKSGEAPKGAKSDDLDAKGRVPPGRLREQTERAKAAEAERDTLKAEREAERKEAATLKAQLDLVLRQVEEMRRNPAPAQAAKVDEPKKAPDLFEDPQGFVSHLTSQFNGQLTALQTSLVTQRIEDSMADAHERHKDVFEKAYDAVGKLDRQNPAHQATVRSIWNARNPGEALVRWHREQETLREVGSDPAAFRKKIGDEAVAAALKDPEVRKQLLADLREEAGAGDDDGKPRTKIKLPKSLNGASGGRSAHGDDSATLDDSDRGLFERAFQRA